MASFQPTITSSGRQVKPSWKLKEKLATTAYTEYQHQLHELNNFSNDMTIWMEMGEEAGRMNKLYDYWLENLRELVNTESQYTQLAPDDELQQHRLDYQCHISKFDDLKDELECYITTRSCSPPQHTQTFDPSAPSYPSEESRNSSPVDTRQLKNETTRLKAEIARLEADLASKNTPRIPKTATAPPLPFPDMEVKKSCPFRYYEESSKGSDDDYDPPGYTGGPDRKPYQAVNLPGTTQSYNLLQPYGPQGMKPSVTSAAPRLADNKFIPQYTGTQQAPVAPPITKSQPPPSRGYQLAEYTPVRQHPLTPTESAHGTHQSDTLAVLSQLAQLLSHQNEERLPEMEPKVFTGDMLKFPNWMNSFEALAERKAKSVSQLLFMLDKYTDGDAKYSIQGCLDSRTNDAYVKAKGILIHRYGDQVKIADLYKKKLIDWPMVKRGDAQGLQRLSDFLWQCHNAMDIIGHLTSLDSQDENVKILRKLPQNIADRWNRIVVRWMAGSRPEDSVSWHKSRQFPPFKEFCKYIEDEARVAAGPCNVQRDASPSKSSTPAQPANNSGSRPSFPRRRQATALATAASSSDKAADTRAQRKPWCAYCKEEHYISQCSTFLSLTSDVKKNFAKGKGMCFGCLRRTHMYKDCRSRNTSIMAEPGSKDPPKKKTNDAAMTLQTATNETTPDTDPSNSASALAVPRATAQSMNTQVTSDPDLVYSSMIIPVEVSHADNPGVSFITYTIIDTQSNSTFISTELAEKLHVKLDPVQLELVTLGNRVDIQSSVLSNLRVKQLGEGTHINISKCYTRDHIPHDESSIPDPSLVSRWPHLAKVSEALSPVMEGLGVGLLIGYKTPEAFVTLDDIFLDYKSPHAKLTPLGWCVFGCLDPGKKQDKNVHFSYSTSVKEITSESIKKIFDIGFEHTESNQMQSSADKRFMSIMDKGIRLTDDGHFELPLPFKTDTVQLPNNRNVALKRMMSLKKRLLRDERYKDHYIAFMQKMIDKGYCSPVPEDEMGLANGLIWYLTHLGVYHPKKLDQLRVVFNGSLEYLGIALNHLLLPGPDQINSLAGVLCRFREEPVAFTCDVEGMFLQVRVAKEHRNLLRFLWFKNNDPNEELVEMYMLVHLFGAVSSPGCSNYAFTHNAVLHQKGFMPETVQFIKNDFYVDDGIKCNRTVQMTVKMMLESHELCKLGGFNLHKFASSHQEVMDQIPKELHAPDKLALEFGRKEDSIDRTLGVGWNRTKDRLIYQIHRQVKTPTRRGLLSALGSIFDPLGLIGPVLLVGRLILQELCSQKFGWDDPVPAHLLQQWEEWFNGLEALANYSIPRCIRPSDIEIAGVEYHHFSDASQKGFGACTYVRFYSKDQQASSALVYAKARVAPAKMVSIPRLELQAAVQATKDAKFVTQEMSYTDAPSFFWTDSSIVLGYLSNESKKFHIFVANRVEFIKERTQLVQWNHVISEDNPADYASRGQMPTDFITNRLWLDGPDFLKHVGPHVHTNTRFTVPAEDPKVKKIVIANLTKTKRLYTLIDDFSIFSSWWKLRKSVAIWMKYLKILRAKVQNRIHRRQITVSDLYAAERYIYREVQRTSFPEVYESLKRQKDVTQILRQSKLRRLDAFLDDFGIMRVGGRIRRAHIPYEMVHPRLLPKQHFITTLIIRFHHVITNHSGRTSTLNSSRCAGIWIVQGRSAVEKHVRDCVTCQEMRGKPVIPKMSDLPEERLEESPPFTFCGADFFGPIEVKQGRVKRKRWVCAFTCLVSRCLHLEPVHSMTTDCFLLAYRRFVGRRGPIRLLRCDRGTNFIGAKSELEKALDDLDTDKISQRLLKDNCDWINFEYNFPKASHMGGVWERMVKVAQDTADFLLRKHGDQLDDESLHTFLVETENIANSRPLTFYDGVCPESEEPLTPSQLLTTKTKITLPMPGNFVAEDVYCRKHWKRVQFLCQQFWIRWRKEFLITLNERKKWDSWKKDLQLDDIVMLIEEDTPRAKWPLARIVQLHPSKDGRIRKVTVKAKDTTYDRPVSKMILLYRQPEETSLSTEPG